MYDLKSIMRQAWAQVRDIRARYEAWQIERGIVDGSFRTALRSAWFQAKKTAAQRKAFERLSEEQKAIVAVKQKARRDTIYLPAHVSMAAEVRRIQNEINAIVGVWFDLDAATMLKY